MSKKHFIALAAEFKRNKPTGEVGHLRERLQQWTTDVKSVANVCSNHNDAFNYHRFIEACGMGGE